MKSYNYSIKKCKIGTTVCEWPLAVAIVFADLAIFSEKEGKVIFASHVELL
jgi:hypothetical protein